MMYRVKRVITHEEDISLPKCMYNLKAINPDIVPIDYYDNNTKDDLNIGNQVIKFLKSPNKEMAELEMRQDQLLEKLDILYERVKTISSLCNTQTVENVKRVSIETPEEIVISTSPDNLPWYLTLLAKGASSQVAFQITWHIHSSVVPEKVVKIKNFVKHLPLTSPNEKSKLRLIFKNGESEMKLSATSIPIIGDVNILRYLSYVNPAVYTYIEDFAFEALLDMCYLLQIASEKQRPAIVNELFVQQKDWIYMKQFSIADVAAYNVIKQWQNLPKYVPRAWFDKYERL